MITASPPESHAQAKSMKYLVDLGVFFSFFLTSYIFVIIHKMMYMQMSWGRVLRLPKLLKCFFGLIINGFHKNDNGSFSLKHIYKVT